MAESSVTLMTTAVQRKPLDTAAPCKLPTPTFRRPKKGQQLQVSLLRSIPGTSSPVRLTGVPRVRPAWGLGREHSSPSPRGIVLDPLPTHLETAMPTHRAATHAPSQPNSQRKFTMALSEPRATPGMGSAEDTGVVQARPAHGTHPEEVTAEMGAFKPSLQTESRRGRDLPPSTWEQSLLQLDFPTTRPVSFHLLSQYELQGRKQSGLWLEVRKLKGFRN